MNSEDNRVGSNQYFINAASILKEILNKLNKESNFLWSGYDNYDEAEAEIKKLIERLELMDLAALEETNLLFCPTGTLQELSIDNGWSDYYIKVSSKFDSIYTYLKAGEMSNSKISEIAPKGFLSRLIDRMRK